MAGESARRGREYRAGPVSARWKSPSWFAITLLCAGLALFCTLGTWQLKRAHEKETLLASFSGAAAQPTLTLSEARRTTADAVHHPHVRLEGRFDARHAYLLDDQVRDARRGVIAFALFEPVDGSLPILVNRGFVAREGAAAPTLPPLPEGDLVVSGLYAPPPGSGLRLGGNALPNQTGPTKSTIYIDLGEIGEDAGRRIDTSVLLLDAEPGSGFERTWTPQILPPERHRGYALQWFSFAIAAIVIFIVLHRRRTPSR